MVFAYPDEKFQIVLCDPSELTIQDGRVLHDPAHPA